MFSFALFARAILSWFDIGPTSSIYPVWHALQRGTEPILEPIRRLIPRIGRLDLSILLVIIAINAVAIPMATAL